MSDASLPDGYRVIAIDEAEERFGLSADTDYQYFREVAGEQEIRLYEAGMHVDGNLIMRARIGEDLCPCVIIDGDLAVGRDLICSCDEGVGYFCLVTGNVQARNVLLSGFPHVVARGDLTVANGILGQQGDDGGFLSVGGDTLAQIVVNTLDFTMTFAHRPRAVVVSDPDRTNCAADLPDSSLEGIFRAELLRDEGYVHTDEIEKALVAGQPILCSGVMPRDPRPADGPEA